jgi:hypothetical protein
MRMVPSNSAQLQKDLCAYARPARPPRSATYTARDAVERLFIPVSAIGLPKRGSKVDEHLPSAGHVKKTQIKSQHQEFGPKVSKGGAVTAIFDACALVPFGPCAQTTGRAAVLALPVLATR